MVHWIVTSHERYTKGVIAAEPPFKVFLFFFPFVQIHRYRENYDAAMDDLRKACALNSGPEAHTHLNDVGALVRAIEKAQTRVSVSAHATNHP